MEAVGINWPGLLTQLISFLILFLLLKKFLYRPVIKMLEDRAEKIKTSLEAADKIKQEAEQTTAANESLMLKAREESQALISESREQAKKIKESELEKSKLQIEIERKRALDEIRSEEDKIIKPAIRKIKKLKINITGPLSADTLFLPKSQKKFDVVVGMYHDQVLTPIKTIMGLKAINITLGLPFIRVSPDHGVAADIVGKKIADPSSLIESIKFFNNIK